MRLFLTAITLFVAATAFADPLKCDLSGYTALTGLTAAVDQDTLVVTWAGDEESELRAQYGIQGGQPVIRELAIRKQGGQWAPLGRDLVPEYYVVSGVRRMTTQQAQPLRQLGVEITPEVIEREKWYAFWDAPLLVPGTPESLPPRQGQKPTRGGQASGRQAQGRGQGGTSAALGLPEGRVFGLPRTPEEVRRADASFAVTSCTVKTDGARIEVTFPGLSMGIFAGDLRFTAYRGTRMFRMDAIVKTDEPSVAYKYEGGLRGFSTSVLPRVTWRDTGGDPQQYEFGGIENDARVNVKAKNRVLVAEGKGGSVATFPSPHRFFFTREVDTNLGYVWYRKDSDSQFGIGVRQAEGEEVVRYLENFALHNAPPGTWQHMSVYFLASADAAEPTRDAAMAFTRGDRFKAVPGYKTMVNHFHLRFTERLRAAGSLEHTFQDLMAMRAIGINIVGLSDFHGDLRGNDTGPGRFEDQRDYALASQKASDTDFLVTPWEEPSAYFGGHYNVMFPKNVYWTKRRDEGQPFTESLPGFDKVYHTGSTDDVQRMLDAEGGYWFHAHPRTKGTTGYPEAIFDKPWVKNDRYLGIAFKPGMGEDLSQQRICEYRCFDAIDTMNNLYANAGLRPKYLIGDVDTYQKGPEDDLYPGHPVNYVKLDRLPGPADDWSPILKAVRSGDFWVTTGEILIKSYAVEGSGAQRTINAELEWTFPLEFVEVVWGDGKKVDRQVIRATDLPPFSTKRFNLPFDATGKAWVRFAAWDSAGNGAFVQPVWLTAQGQQTSSSR
ncbi:MAG: hypothetical protein GEV06_05510 [Luteitalea sp.]|nr:hypothetical protein [Luteitalea sp.]